MDIGTVSILEAEPALARGIDTAEYDAAAGAAWARTGVLHPGGLEPHAVSKARPLGFLLLNGLMTRRIQVGGRHSVEFLGAGDVLHPSPPEDESYETIPIDAVWRVIDMTWIAIIDRDFPRRMARWPSVMGNLIERAAKRADSLAVRLAVAQIPRLTSRLLVVLWHMADRWGHVERDGVVLPLRLSHAILAELVCAQRPSVSNALHELQSRGLVDRRPDGGWQLLGAPPSELLDATTTRLRGDARVAAGGPCGSRRSRPRGRGNDGPG